MQIVNLVRSDVTTPFGAVLISFRFPDLGATLDNPLGPLRLGRESGQAGRPTTRSRITAI
jgi:hypothetical protein